MLQGVCVLHRTSIVVYYQSLLSSCLIVLGHVNSASSRKEGFTPCLFQQAKELLDHLECVLSNEPVEVVAGAAIIEVKLQRFYKFCLSYKALISLHTSCHRPRSCWTTWRTC